MKQIEQGLVSIIIPTRDRGELLMQTLESVRRQTYTRWEAIVVDDNSKDDTAQRVADSIAQDGRIHWRPREPGEMPGACAARNRGLTCGRGEFVIFLDSDDLLAEHCLAQRVEVMNAHGDLDFAVFPCRLFRSVAGDTDRLWNVDKPEDDIERYLRKDIPWQTAAAIWRRGALQKVGPWDEAAPSWQDWEFYLRALIKGSKYARFGTCDLHWRLPASGRDSIGRRAQQPHHVRHRARMLLEITQLILDTNQLTPLRRTLLAANFYNLSRAMTSEVSRADGFELWGKALKLQLIGLCCYLEGLFVLRFSHRPRIGPMLLRHVKRAWPADMHLKVSTTQLNTPLPGTELIPALSVVMPVYNGQRYLVQAIESILGQTFRDFEFIIVDDGSTDETASIIERCAAEDPRIFVVRREHRGQTASLNEGIAQARGHLIARMDADDLSLPQRFEKQVDYLEQHPHCVCVGCRVTPIDEYGAPITPAPEHQLTHEQIEADLLRGIGWAVVHPAATMRADAVRRIGGYREQFRTSQDLDLFLRLAEIGKLANLPEPLVKYRQHFESVNFARHEEQTRVKGQIVADAYRRRGLPMPDEHELKLVHRNALPVAEQLKQWAWSTIKSGNAWAARKHAAKVLRLQPWSVDSWRVMYAALRGW